MNMPKIIENSSQVIDDILDLIFCFVKSFLEISSRAEVTFNTAL
jgi:hypothetical protein